MAAAADAGEPFGAAVPKAHAALGVDEHHRVVHIVQEPAVKQLFDRRFALRRRRPAGHRDAARAAPAAGSSVISQRWATSQRSTAWSSPQNSSNCLTNRGSNCLPAQA